MTRISFETMHKVIANAFVNAGMKEPAAETCARIHTEASCDGVYSHGLNRVSRFVEFLQRGWVNPNAGPIVVKKLSAIEIYDGNQGPGVLNALFATDRAMEIAAQHTVGIVALRNTSHWMRGGAYGWHAAKKGFMMIAWTNTDACMPAWGGRDRRLGNNPLVIAVPRDQGHIVLDMAMSQYSYGRLQSTRLKGQSLPFPGGFDIDGRLTLDPGAIEQSKRILPTGYWKGSGLSILLDIFAAVLSEGSATNGIDRAKQGSCAGCSQVFIAFNPRQLGGQAFTEEVANGVVDDLKASDPAEQNAAPRYPGESTARIRKDHLANGIVVDDRIWTEVVALAERNSAAS